MVRIVVSLLKRFREPNSLPWQRKLLSNHARKRMKSNKHRKCCQLLQHSKITMIWNTWSSWKICSQAPLTLAWSILSILDRILFREVAPNTDLWQKNLQPLVFKAIIFTCLATAVRITTKTWLIHSCPIILCKIWLSAFNSNLHRSTDSRANPHFKSVPFNKEFRHRPQSENRPICRARILQRLRQ